MQDFIEEEITDCPCGSNKEFSACCEPYIEGKSYAPTAESLMRSRYSAFVVENIDYLLNTHDPSTRHENDREDIKNWSENSIWEGLNILGTQKGGESDSTGKVEFVAHYHMNGKDENHHELSEFVKKDGQWFFHQGYMVDKTYRRQEPKLGRNDPCHCGSGKKFKKCHGA